METQKTIKIWFKVDTEKGAFQDALYFTEDEFNNLKNGEVETQAQARADAWVAFLNNPPIPVELTKEEMQLEANNIAQQILDLEAKKLELEDIISKI